MKKNQVKEITQEEALKALKPIKGKIHCFMGMVGADWDKDSVIELIKKTERVAWAYNIFSHDLAVISDGKLYNFDIKHETI